MSASSLSIVIPAYNEASSIATVVMESLAILRAYFKDYEVVIINDASNDGTRDIAEELQKLYPEHLRVLHHPERRGMATTFEAAYAAGRKEYVWLVHGDGQYPPGLLKEVVPLLGTWDLILLARNQKYYGFYRHVLSAAYRVLPFLLFGIDLQDSGCSKCIKREIITSVPTFSRGIFVEVERVLRAAKRGYRLYIAPVQAKPRVGGLAKGGDVRSIIEVLRDITILWWYCIVRRQKW